MHTHTHGHKSVLSLILKTTSLGRYKRDVGMPVR